MSGAGAPAAPHAGPVHVIAPLPGAAARVRRILAGAEPPSLIVDLTAGYAGASSTLRAEVADALAGRAVAWIDGLELAAEVADAARDAQVAWTAELASAPLAGGASLRELFAYRDLTSLWWLLPSSKRHPMYGAYGWLFYMLFALERVRREVAAGAAWHVWAGDRRTARVLRAALAGAGPVRAHAPRGRTLSVMRDAARTARRMAAAARIVARARRLARAYPPAESPWDASLPGPKVLLHSLYPRFWECGDGRVGDGGSSGSNGASGSGGCRDRYFADLPWTLVERGMTVAWMPAFDAGDRARWRELLDRQDLPDAMPWMRLGAREAGAVLAHLARWTARAAWLFGVRRAHRGWRWRGIPIGAWLRDELWRGATGEAVGSLVQLEQMRAACRALRPDVVVHRNEFMVNGRIVDAAANGIAPCVGVQHGLLGRQVGVYQYHAGEVHRQRGADGRWDFVRHCPAPDVLAAFGAYYRDDYFGAWEGFPAERVFPTGGVRHDALLRRFGAGRTAEERGALRRALGLPEEGRVVLLCTTYARDAAAWFTDVVEGLRAAGIEAYVAVKPHPEHPVDAPVRAAAETLGWTAYGLFGGEVYPLMAAADVVAAGPSTTTLEAYLLGTPVVSLAAGRGWEPYPYAAEGIGEPASGARETAEALARVLADPAAYRAGFERRREEVLRRHLDNADGGARARVAELVARVARGSGAAAPPALSAGGRG